MTTRTEARSEQGIRQRLKARRGRTGLPPVRGLLPIVVAIACWQLFGSSSSALFPRPSEWLTAIGDSWTAGTLADAIMQTVYGFLISLGVATVLGTVLGLAIGIWSPLNRALNPLLQFIRAMPSAAVVPVFVLLLGYGYSMKVTVVVLTAIWPILLNTLYEVRDLSPTLLDTGRTLRLTLRERVFKLLLPAMAPAVMLGVRVAAPVALIITLLVEILTGVSGMGAMLSEAQRNYRSALVFGLIVLTGILGLVINAIVTSLSSLLARHRGLE